MFVRPLIKHLLMPFAMQMVKEKPFILSFCRKMISYLIENWQIGVYEN